MPPGPPRTKTDIVFDLKGYAALMTIGIVAVLATASRELGLWYCLTQAPLAEHITRMIPAPVAKPWLPMIPRLMAVGGAIALLFCLAELLVLTYRQRPRQPEPK